MKKLLLAAVLLSAAFAAVAQTPQQMPSQDRPPLYRPAYAYDSPTPELFRRYQAIENTGGSGFYWLDSTRGDLWRLDAETKEWSFLGSPRGASTGPKGTYTALSDQNGGLYVLNTENGEGWWTDGTGWKIVGDLSRRIKKAE